MELSELQSTPSSAQHQRLLVDAHGNPLKINLQAVELEGRPKLVRTLKGSGALVVSNAKEAAVILVDSSTESGKRLIRTWGHDPRKVVLEYTWVRASMDVGRPLLEADNWGGAMTIDDGKPVTIDGVVVDEDEIEEVEALVTKSPLPTPRVTPVDPASQRPENTVVERADTIQSAPSLSRTTGPPLLTPPVVQPVPVSRALSKEPMASAHDSIPPQSSPPVPATPSLPHPQPPLYQPQNTYAYAPFATQQLYPPSQPQMMPSQPFPHTGLPSQPHQPQMVYPPSVPHTPLPSVQSPMPQMPPNVTSMNGVDLQNFATIMTIMEVVRHMDQSNRFGQSHLPTSQPPVNPNPSAFSERPTTPGPTPSTSTPRLTGGSESPGIDTSLTSTQNRSPGGIPISRKRGLGTDVLKDRSLTRKPHIKPSRHPSDEKLAPSVSRKRPPAIKPTNPPPKRLRKGEDRAVSSDSSEHDTTELSEASDDSYSIHSSASPPARPRIVVARKKHGEIFLSRSGQPLRFFVQVDLHGRHNVVTNVKKNKGKIVNNIADADYSILFARSETFQGLLNEAIALGKSPILAAFVADCVEEGALLDETDYILDSVAKVKALKRGRQNAFSIKVETSETLPHVIKAVKPKPSPSADKGKKMKVTLLTDKKTKKAPKSAVSKRSAEGCEGLSRSRSPTPPPEETRQMMKNGRYLFTKVEDEYFLLLAKHHLACDPTISNTSLINKLHKKMPHHSSASWTAHIDKKLKGTLEDIRKRANIAKRKRANEAGSRNQNLSRQLIMEDVPLEDDVMDVQETDATPNHTRSSQGDMERQDFEVITQFFASGGGGDDDDDERVWQELEKHQPCRSTSSWPEYYAAHQEEVYARIEELTGERAGD